MTEKPKTIFEITMFWKDDSKTDYKTLAIESRFRSELLSIIKENKNGNIEGIPLSIEQFERIAATFFNQDEPNVRFGLKFFDQLEIDITECQA